MKYVEKYIILKNEQNIKVLYKHFKYSNMLVIGVFDTVRRGSKQKNILEKSWLKFPDFIKTIFKNSTISKHKKQIEKHIVTL